MAPELIGTQWGQDKGYSKAIDWYSLGILMYELFYGKTPYTEQDEQTILQKKVDYHNDKILFSRNMDTDAKSLIKKLTQKIYSKRYGSHRKNGVENIKKHKFFSEINWDEIENMNSEVPKPIRNYMNMKDQ